MRRLSVWLIGVVMALASAGAAGAACNVYGTVASVRMFKKPSTNNHQIFIKPLRTTRKHFLMATGDSALAQFAGSLVGSQTLVLAQSSAPNCPNGGGAAGALRWLRANPEDPTAGCTKAGSTLFIKGMVIFVRVYETGQLNEIWIRPTALGAQSYFVQTDRLEDVELALQALTAQSQVLLRTDGTSCPPPQTLDAPSSAGRLLWFSSAG